MNNMTSYFGGNSLKRHFSYPFYISEEKRLRKIGINADFKFYLSFFNFKNLKSKFVLDVGTDPASPEYFIKNKAGNVVVSRDDTSKLITESVFNGNIISLNDAKNMRADVLKFDYSPKTKMLFDSINLSAYNEWIVVFNKNEIDGYDYEVKTRLMRDLGGTKIGSKDNEVIVWGKIDKE